MFADPSHLPSRQPVMPNPDDRSDGELVLLARAGDEVALTGLLSRYRPLVRQRARCYFLVGADRDDVVQEGLIGLYKAVRDFDPTLDTTFHGFAELCVSRQLISAVKAATRHKHGPLNSYVSFSRPVGTGDGDDRSLAELLPAPVGSDPIEVVIGSERAKALADHVNASMSDLEIEVLRLHVDGNSHLEISEIVHRPTKTVDNALQRVKRKLDAHLRERELVH